MDKIVLFALACCLCYTQTDTAECENGWAIYKDELCLKAFADFLTYDEAKNFCVSQGNSVSTASLVMIKEADLQEFIADYTKDIFENLWLGSKYDNATGQFKWEDGETLTYTNWADGYPRNSTNSEVCIQMRPVNAKTSRNLEGKWEDTVCQRRNLALCQRTLSWTLEDATREILAVRKELQATKVELLTTQKELQTTKEELQTDLDGTKEKLEATSANLLAVSNRVVPVGSIYIEYYGQPAPRTLWPALGWQDISSSYAGLFFRVYGSVSGAWGATQDGCAPRISKFQYAEQQQSQNPMVFPKSGWSDWVRLGWYSGNGVDLENGKFEVEDCEIRPRNQAVRIWKRIA